MKTFLGQNNQLGKKSARVINKPIGFTIPDNGKVSIVTFNGFLQLVYWEAISQNPVAINLVVSGFGDSLRSLALKEFGQGVSEEARQNWLGDRHASKEALIELSVAIDKYIKKNPEKSDNYKRWIYSNCQDSINRGLFGKAAKKIREELELGDGLLLRDHYGRYALRRLEAIQSLACRYILKSDVEPQDAVKKAVEEFNYGIINYRE